MAEMSLRQITDKLNEEFKGSNRKLIFWYDEKAEFVEDVDSLELHNAKVFHLEKNNQFYTKYFLEKKDQTTNYVLYAPYPRPHESENHLEDLLLYSKQFFADKASLIAMDLGIDARYKPLLEKYMKFFESKERTQKFYNLEIEHYSKEAIEVGIMSVLSKSRISNFEEALRGVLLTDNLEDNKYLSELGKYNLLEVFWALCETNFGYLDAQPSLEKLIISLFVTYIQKYFKDEIPASWKNFICHRPGNVIAFMDSLKNSFLYRDRYDELSLQVSQKLRAKEALQSYSPETILESDSFQVFDEFIIQWIVERLLQEDLGAKLHNLSIVDVCKLRRKSHYADTYRSEYHLLESAFFVIQAATYSPKESIQDLINQYVESDFKIDHQYRKFYFNFDQIKDTIPFEKLRDLVENIYSNVYLSKITTKWNKALDKEGMMSIKERQQDFFIQYVSSSNDRVVVIISDALRYEVGRTLFERLDVDEKCTPMIKHMISTLPSYTKLGMAALLPHKQIELTDEYKVLVDGYSADSLKQREVILQQATINSVCVQFDDLKTMKKNELRDVFTGKQVVYVYHNQIDARGDKLNTENEVFMACQEAVEEIHTMIRRISSNANTHHFIVTADHGFIYKRDKVQETDKIIHLAEKDAYINRRFIISHEKIQDDGILCLPLSSILRNEDSKNVIVPLSTHVYKVAGGGQNFVHGGSSPQEMIIPVIDVKVERGHAETRAAQITLVSMLQKATSLITSLDFIQTEPVSDVIKETSYRIYFISEDQEKISNEYIVAADKKDENPSKRIFRLKFNFKNKQYSRAKKYYLVAFDEKNDIELFRHEIVMDIAFSDDFGFNV